MPDIAPGLYFAAEYGNPRGERRRLTRETGCVLEIEATFDYVSDQRCRAVHPNGHWCCTRRPGHANDHVAGHMRGRTGEVVARWPRT